MFTRASDNVDNCRESGQQEQAPATFGLNAKVRIMKQVHGLNGIEMVQLLMRPPDAQERPGATRLEAAPAEQAPSCKQEPALPGGDHEDLM